MRKLTAVLFGILLTAISSFATLPSKVYAPYVDVMLWPTFSLMNCYNATGQKYYTLAFITAGGDGQPSWGGITALNQNFMLDQITQLRSVGGDVIISFGGANGTPIDASITNVSSLVTAYSAVIDKYGLTWIDFDIEGAWGADQASIDRRNQAAKQLQTKYPGLRITYCLPVATSGLVADGVNIINKAKAAGVNIYSVNVMAMDYGGANGAMGSAAISAAQGARSQTGLNIGITPMIGQNDSPGEIFSLGNATEVVNFAKANSYVNMLAMWSATRDNGGCAGQTYASPTCSGVSQGQFAFVNIFKAFTGTTGGGGGGGGSTAPIGKTITLKGFNNQYVSGENGTKPMWCNRPTAGTWEKFLVVDAGSGKIGLQSMAKFVSSENGAATGITCNRATVGGSGSWEQFDWVANADGTISLRGNNGLYISSENGTKAMTCTRTAIAGWEAFTYAVTTAGRIASDPTEEVATENPVALGTFDMSPNPAASGTEHVLTLHFASDQGDINVHLKDMNGANIASHNYKNVQEQLDVQLPALPQGMYLIRVQGKQKSMVQKYVIK